jgi:hypothetical protein
MSTRANILIKDSSDFLFFYRHSDGYPECTGESLREFVKGYAEKYRSNVMQSAGWLVIHGNKEYSDNQHNGWKVGAYEPTTGSHGDIDYLYEIDLENKTLSCWEHFGSSKGKLVFQEGF